MTPGRERNWSWVREEGPVMADKVATSSTATSPASPVGSSSSDRALRRGTVHISSRPTTTTTVPRSHATLRGENTHKVYGSETASRAGVLRMELRQIDLGLVEVLDALARREQARTEAHQGPSKAERAVKTRPQKEAPAKAVRRPERVTGPDEERSSATPSTRPWKQPRPCAHFTYPDSLQE